jgi:hypothetical protein
MAHVLLLKSMEKLIVIHDEFGFVFFFCFHHQLNVVRGSVLTSSGSRPLPIAVAEDRTAVLPTKFNVNHH